MSESLFNSTRRYGVASAHTARFCTVARQLIWLVPFVISSQTVLAQAMYRMEDLGPHGGSPQALALNELGQVAGYTLVDTGVCCIPRAFIWKNNGTPTRNLGTLGGAESVANDLNDSGQVTGESGVKDPSIYARAFLWRNDGSPMQDLGDLEGKGSSGTAINSYGQVAGHSAVGDGGFHAFFWRNNGTPMRDLGTLGDPNSMAFDLNDSGQVAGDSIADDGTSHAFLWRNDGKPMLSLGDLGGGDSHALAINSSGQVAGYSRTRGIYSHAFLWRNDGTPMQDLGALRGTGSVGLRINNSGQVTGHSGSGPFIHAFLWKNDGTPMKDLGTLGGNGSEGRALNKLGQVTGTSKLKGNTASHAFLWRNDGTRMQDLNALIDPADPLKPYVTLVTGLEINDASEIVADGTDSRTGDTHAYFLHGTVLTLSPRGVAFGSRKVNSTSTAQAITVTNTSVKAAAITSVALAGTAVGQFALINNCGKSLAGHAACVIKVSFTPTTKGAKSAFLNVNGGGGGLRSVSLTGTGT